jgi:ATP-dependent Clp protease adaptor protein ClpS
LDARASWRVAGEFGYDESLPMATLLETVEQTADETLDESSLEPQFHVVLLDDNFHTYDYIVEMLGKLFFYTVSQAFRHAAEVDTTGRSIIITCARSEAEYARDQIHAYGRDWRVPDCKGSMTAVLEPAAEGSGGGARACRV